MITHIESMYGAREVVESEKYLRPRIWGLPRLDEMTVDELRYNIIYLENKLHDKERLFRQLFAAFPDDAPLPNGISYWNGITKAQIKVEAARRHEARV